MDISDKFNKFISSLNSNYDSITHTWQANDQTLNALSDLQSAVTDLDFNYVDHDEFLSREHNIHIFDEIDFIPDEVLDKDPFARIHWFNEKGDRSVGIPDSYGFTLIQDQSGTGLDVLLKSYRTLQHIKDIVEDDLDNISDAEKIYKIILSIIPSYMDKK